MYYRRKVILALLQQFGGNLKPTRFQKLLLIFTRQQQKPAYEFIPYKYGAYSMQARSDKGTMIKYELLKDSDIWEVNTEEDYISQLNKGDREVLVELHSRFDDADYNDLVGYTYREYPFYAINSEIASKYLDDTGLNIELVRPHNESHKLYTVGYEGIKAEAYMNKLISKDVRLLVDVRKNSMSMKYGFNKSQLKDMCSKLGIAFMHIPELGIESDKRKNLDSKADYNKLFNEYEQETLPNRTTQLEKLYSLFKEYDRVAITCFEKEHTSCHRHKISDHLNSKYEVPIEHL